MANLINIVPSESDLAKSAIKYRNTLLMLPIFTLEESLQHMSLRVDLRDREIVGQLEANMQFRPHDVKAIDQSDINIIARELEVFHGSVVKEFDPLQVVKTLYGNNVLKGEGLKTVPITLQVLSYLAKKLGENLHMVLWNAVRNPSGSTSKDLFNGFDTITQTEITNTKITTALGNLYEFAEAIDETNAVDALKTLFESAHDLLQSQNTKLFIPRSIYNAYLKDYQSTVGATPYNREYKKTFLEGSDDKCQLVPLSNKKGSNFIHLTTASNMLIGVNTTNDQSSITVEKHAAWVLQFVAACMFGVQFESIAKERMLVGKLFQG